MVKFYGFEEYKLSTLYSDLIGYAKITAWNFNYYNHFSDNTIIFPFKEGYVEGYPSVHLGNLITENKELADTAKTLYIHPSCKLSRSLVTQKYKKLLNPWLADAVVIPKNGDTSTYNRTAVFINENTKDVYAFPYMSKEESEKVQAVPKGTKLKDVILDKNAVSNFPNRSNVFDAEFEYFGTLVGFSKNTQYLLDIHTNALPKGKLLYENTVMEKLGNEENKPTFENLISIDDMLSSSDSEVVGSAIKALSMMDYINYPNSVIEVLKRHQSNYCYNPAVDTTAAKYMFKFFSGGTARRYLGHRMNNISSEDYELFKKLIYHFDNPHNDREYMQYIRAYPFIFETVEGTFVPRYK